eukprot:Pompholyxophrys_sp_v1_NODE_20_length_4050_cov_7.809011.p2 type:complete len:159 gc:universal NODE_20_length_4050_cov_7.809011:1856-2332(+)
MHSSTPSSSHSSHSTSFSTSPSASSSSSSSSSSPSSFSFSSKFTTPPCNDVNFTTNPSAKIKRIPSVSLISSFFKPKMSYGKINFRRETFERSISEMFEEKNRPVESHILNAVSYIEDDQMNTDDPIDQNIDDVECGCGENSESDVLNENEDLVSTQN